MALRKFCFPWASVSPSELSLAESIHGSTGANLSSRGRQAAGSCPSTPLQGSVEVRGSEEVGFDVANWGFPQEQESRGPAGRHQTLGLASAEAKGRAEWLMGWGPVGESSYS